MITRERDAGRTLPSIVDSQALGLTFSFRIADTNGVKNSNTNWVYYELPASAVISRNRSCSLEQMSQQVSLTILEDLLPDYYTIQPFMVLEIDLVDKDGFRWPYHTGPIDGIRESYNIVDNSIRKTLEINSFGVLQNTKDAFYIAQYWSPATSTFTGNLTGYATVKHFSYTGIGRVPGTVQLIDGSMNSAEVLTTGTFPGVVVSTNSDFSAPYTRGVQYEITNSAGVLLVPATSKNEPLYIKWIITEPNAQLYIKFWTVDYFAVSRTTLASFPAIIRLPDYSQAFTYALQPPLKRYMWDDFVTTIASGATTTIVTPIDTSGYKLIAGNPAGAPTEFVEWQRADTGAREVRQVSSINAGTGAVTVTSAFSSAPVAGDYLRVVTTRPFPSFERFNNNQLSGLQNQPTFAKTSGGTAYSKGGFEVKPEQGIVVPTYGNHFDSSTALVYVSNLIVNNVSEGTLGTDNRVETLVYSALTDYVGTSKVLTGNPADGANYYGNHTKMNAFVNVLDASGETSQALLQKVATNGFPPNGKLFDRPDGTVLVAALRQSPVSQYTIGNVISVSKENSPAQPTAVTVISKFPESQRLNRGLFQAWEISGSNIANFNYLFDGIENADPTNTGTDSIFASVALPNYGDVLITVPDFGPIVLDPLDKIVIKGLTGVVVASLLVKNSSTNAYTKQNYFWGGQPKVVQQDSPLEIDAKDFQAAYQAYKGETGFSPGRQAFIYLRFDNTNLVQVGGNNMAPRITEIELWSKYNCSWTALLTDDLVETNDTSTYPTGWNSYSSVTNVGSIWWKRGVSITSHKYMNPSVLKRIQPLYNANWTSNRPRMTVINQTRISITECRQIAERYIDEMAIKSAEYTVDALFDPRVELGDTVTVNLPDGSCLDLFVWQISDSGGPGPMMATYKLVDYSGVA